MMIALSLQIVVYKSKHDIRITEGVIVDVTLVESHARPRRKEFIETEPVGDDEIPGQTTFQATALTIEESKDPEARITKMPCKRGTWFRES